MASATAEQTAKPEGLEGGTFEFVMVDRCVPTADCARAIDEKSPRFRELMDSIRANGVMVPIIVRRINKPGLVQDDTNRCRWEVRAGKRRLLASQRLALEEIPAICYLNMDDETAWRVTYLENAAREDLTPMEQGAIVLVGLQRLKGDSRTLAAMLGAGWSERRVRMFAQLKNLSKTWRELAANPDSAVSTWSADHLALIARYSQELQDEIAKDTGSGIISAQGHELSLKELEGELNHKWERKLAGAPFPVGALHLTAKAGPCVACVKRSSYCPGLFDEEALPPRNDVLIPKNDRCLDVECWEKKTKAWVKHEQARLQAENPDAVAITTQYQNRGGAISQNYWEEAKKTDKGAVPAICTDGADAGKIKYVKVDRRRLAEAEKERERYAARESEANKPKSIEQQKADVVAARNQHVCDAVSGLLSAKKATKEPARPMLERMLSVFGAGGAGTAEMYEFDVALAIKDWRRSADEKKRPALWDQVRHCVAVVLREDCQTDEDEARGLMVGEICAACGIDFLQIQNDAEKKYPMPKEETKSAKDETKKGK